MAVQDGETNVLQADNAQSVRPREASARGGVTSRGLQGQQCWLAGLVPCSAALLLQALPAFMVSTLTITSGQQAVSASSTV